jgi:hypothetical protein
VINITGNIVGGTNSNATGLNIIGSGTVNLTGNITGGSSGTSPRAVQIGNSGGVTFNVTGNVSAGTGGTTAQGIYVWGAGNVTISITGNVTATDFGAAIQIDVAMTLPIIVTGNISSAVANPAIYSGANSAILCHNGDIATLDSGRQIGSNLTYRIHPTSQLTHQYRTYHTTTFSDLGSRSLYTGGINVGHPATGDVRSGTTFGATSEYAGTLAVPSPTLVAIGVATDNTVGSYEPGGGASAADIADAVWDEARSGHVTAGTFGEKVNAELDSDARVKLAADQPDYVPATAAALAAAKTILDKIDLGMVLDGSVYQFTANMLELAPSGGGGSSDWTPNERAAIRAILGIPAIGTTPTDPTTGILDNIRDLVVAYIAAALATVNGTTGTIVDFPTTLNIGDSYTDDCNSSIHVFIRDESDDPITAVGTHDFTDGDFAPECIITQNGNTGRVKCEVEYVTASPESYLKIQIPSKESRRAPPGIATVQVLLKWDGAQKALSKQTVTWEALI